MMRLTACFVLLALVSGCPNPDTQRDWQVAVELNDGAILSFWGNSASDVFAVGGTLLTNGGDAIVLRHEQNAWRRVTLSQTPTLWWVHGFGPSDVWAVGELGTIVHFDGNTWTTVQTGASYTLWGVWGVSPNEMWAVGGTLNSADPSVVLRYDGNNWTEVTAVGLPGELLFKVWGASANVVYVVGSEGVLYWDGNTWSRPSSGTGQRLLTVRGRGPSDVYAVGGIAQSSVLHGGQDTWSVMDVQLNAGLMGVWTAPGQPVLVAGFSGLVAIEENDSWQVQTTPTYDDLHATWGDDQGNFLVGGGNLLSVGTRRGVILSVGDIAIGVQ